MIKEYQSGPNEIWQEESNRYNYAWMTRISINLRFVTSAEPDNEWTYIRYVGSPCGVAINVDYERFLRDWQSVKC